MMRKLSISPKHFVNIPVEFDIDLEIQNTFREELIKEIDYIRHFILPQNFENILHADIEIYDFKDVEGIQVALKYLKALGDIDKPDMINDYVVGEKPNENLYDYVESDEAASLIRDNLTNRVQHNASFYHLDCILKFFVHQVSLYHQASLGMLSPGVLEWTS